jgi:drug/metabolite transporter (DMT)-like permease
MIGWVLAAVMVLSDATSDVLLSKGIKQVGNAPNLRSWDIIGLIQQAARNTSLLVSITFAAIHFGAFVALLSFWDLSLVIPIGALDYVLGTFGASFILGEHVSRIRWIGVCLIAGGVALTSIS